MATLRAPSSAFLSAFLPVVRARLSLEEHAVLRTPSVHRLSRLRLSDAVLPSVLAPIPSLLGQLWNGLLNAVPKKKTSHMKKRHRQMAGKALKDVTALNKCSSCGRVKRAHVLCPYCVKSIRQWLGNGFKTQKEVMVEEKKRFDDFNAYLESIGKKPLKWNDVYEKDEESKGEFLSAYKRS